MPNPPYASDADGCVVLHVRHLSDLSWTILSRVLKKSEKCHCEESAYGGTPATDRPNKHASLDSSAQNADIARDDECHWARTLGGAEASEEKKVIILITKDNDFDETSR